jgi:hypothetical protein
VRPIDPELVGWYLSRERAFDHRLRCAVDRAGVPCLDLEYESFLVRPLSEAQRVAAFNRVLEFLNRRPLASCEAMTRLRWLLMPRYQQQNNAQTYRRIPNIDEIEQRFGSEETGWLFRD